MELISNNDIIKKASMPSLTAKPYLYRREILKIEIKALNLIGGNKCSLRFHL